MKFEQLYPEDHRGKIFRLTFDNGKFVNIIYTKAFKYRSGDYHTSDQYDLCVDGKILITERENLNSDRERDKNTVVNENELIVIDKEVPHLFLSLTDSIVVEWWEKKFDAKYYKKYRDIVDNQQKSEGIDLNNLTDEQILKLVRG